MVSSPCKGCIEREPHCHSVCPYYKEFKEKLEEDNRRIKEYKEKTSRYNPPSSKHKSNRKKGIRWNDSFEEG